jgi:hypothetical protein
MRCNPELQREFISLAVVPDIVEGRACFWRKAMKKAVAFSLCILVTLVMAACSQGDEETTITFNGKECTVTGPTEVPAGDNSFHVRNLTDQKNLALYVGVLLDGHTYQDAVDRQPRPGMYISKPDWIERAKRNSVARPTDLPDDIRHYSFPLEEGDHVLYFYIVHPEAIWFCSPLTVTAAYSG